MGSWILTHLKHLGPESIPARWDRAQAFSYCSRLTNSHYENFSVASAFLPRQLVKPFQAVYSFCRWADDLGDETGERGTSLLNWWRELTHSAFAGQAWHPVFVALQQPIRRYQLQQQPFLDLICAFEQDQSVKTYQTWEQLEEYCTHSANPVGRIVLQLGNSYTPENAILSDQICTGLQLANFWQDVGRDWRNLRRIYVPEKIAEEHGYWHALHQQEMDSPAFRSLMKSLVERTYDYFDRGKPLIDRVDSSIRLDIDLFISGGRAILNELKAMNYDVWHTRPEVSKTAKARLLGDALLREARKTVRKWWPL
jgi:squalene synthase HpnC